MPHIFLTLSSVTRGHTLRGRIVNDEQFYMRMNELRILDGMPCSSPGDIEQIDYLSLATGRYVRFLSACQMAPAALKKEVSGRDERTDERRSEDGS